MLTECKKCGATIETDYGAVSPAEHADAAGTPDDPRSPGDWNDECDVCCYADADHRQDGQDELDRETAERDWNRALGDGRN